MFKKNKKGFTLIELLLTITIILLVASLVVIGTFDVRKKGQDKRIGAEMDQIRKGAELYKDQNGGVYTGLSCSSVGLISALCVDIEHYNDEGDLIIQVSSIGDKYCAYTPLSSSSSRWYCIDSEGKSVETSINPSGSGYCTSTTFVCP